MLQATQDAAVVHELESIEEQLAARWKNRDCDGWGLCWPTTGPSRTSTPR